MSIVVAINDPYDKVRALRRIKRLLKDGDVEIQGHAANQMRERKIDILDVENIIHYGIVTEVSPSRELWRYRVDGKTVDGKSAGCVVEINRHMLLITVFYIGKWTK